VFELDYLPWDVGGRQVSERKRVTLDAGSHFNRFANVYSGDGAAELAWATGIKKAAGADVRIDRERGVLRTWEAFKEPNGHLGAPSSATRPASMPPPRQTVTPFDRRTRVGQTVVPAGSAWDKGGDVSESPTGTA
jgi:hypothetical protein